ncbi:MAG TPA: PqqD family protein [Vicinamibacterales bacterium]|nr:PqqD family protein [Vicinamibacterales bacterium]
MTVAFAARVSVAPDVMFRLVGEEGVLVNLATERYLGLNAVGARMWQVLSNARSIQAACVQLLTEYDVDEATLRADVEDFVEQLLAQQLIHVGSPDPSPPS